MRCWTCKTNGIDIYFDGAAERQLHEKAMHKSPPNQNNCIANGCKYTCHHQGFTSGYAPSGSQLGQNGTYRTVCNSFRILQLH